MIESVDVVTVFGDLSASAATFYEHAVESLGVPRITWASESDTDNGNWLIHDSS
jgi:hypothetical protein